MTITRESLLAFMSGRIGEDLEGIEDTEPLFSSGLLDSFSMVQLMLFIETEAQIQFEREDITLDNIDTIERILKFSAEASEAYEGMRD